MMSRHMRVQCKYNAKSLVHRDPRAALAIHGSRLCEISALGDTQTPTLTTKDCSADSAIHDADGHMTRTPILAMGTCCLMLIQLLNVEYSDRSVASESRESKLGYLESTTILQVPVLRPF